MLNGATSKASHVGNIKLSENLLLRNALYIPTFTFNIVLASKLIAHSGCSLYVMANKCLIMEAYGMMTGFAKEEKWLYLLTSPPKKKFHVYSFMHCSTASLDTWHQRLGHFPVDKIHLLH